MPGSTSSSGSEPALWAVVLAGGIGSRFWPASRPDRPKQLLPLGSDRPLVHDTIERILPLVPRERLRVLAGEDLGRRILEVTGELHPENLLVEPRARGTAPVLVWAASELARRDPAAVMISLHSDHVITPASAFLDLLAAVARVAAATGRLFTIGVPPARAETGYGYIRLGDPLTSHAGTYAVAEFVEKPDLETAERYLSSGEYLWNSGIFVWQVTSFLQEVERHTPELAPLLPLLERGEVRRFFDEAPSLSVDEGLLERSDRVGVARATFQWDDVGSWDAVARTRGVDDAGNAGVGDTAFVDSEGCIAWAEEGWIVLFGATDLIVAQANGITLVAPRDRAPELKKLLERLPPHLSGMGTDRG